MRLTERRTNDRVIRLGFGIAATHVSSQHRSFNLAVDTAENC